MQPILDLFREYSIILSLPSHINKKIESFYNGIKSNYYNDNISFLLDVDRVDEAGKYFFKNMDKIDDLKDYYTHNIIDDFTNFR